MIKTAGGCQGCPTRSFPSRVFPCGRPSLGNPEGGFIVIPADYTEAERGHGSLQVTQPVGCLDGSHSRTQCPSLGQLPLSLYTPLQTDQAPPKLDSVTDTDDLEHGRCEQQERVGGPYWPVRRRLLLRDRGLLSPQDGLVRLSTISPWHSRNPRHHKASLRALVRAL